MNTQTTKTIKTARLKQHADIVSCRHARKSCKSDKENQKDQYFIVSSVGLGQGYFGANESRQYKIRVEQTCLICPRAAVVFTQFAICRMALESLMSPKCSTKRCDKSCTYKQPSELNGQTKLTSVAPKSNITYLLRHNGKL